MTQCKFCDYQSFCMEGPNKGKPGPCPEDKPGQVPEPNPTPPPPKKSFKQKVADGAKAIGDKAKAAGKAIGERLGAKKVVNDFRKAKGLKLPEMTAGAAFTKGMAGVPAALRGGMAAGKTIGEKALYGSIGASQQVQDTLNNVAAVQLKDFKNDWGPVVRGLQSWAKDPANAKKATRLTGRVAAALSGPYARTFKIAQSQYGTIPAIAMSAAIGTSTHAAKPIQAAIFSVTGIPVPSSLVNPVAPAVWGGAAVTKWAIKNGPAIARKAVEVGKGVSKVANKIWNWHDMLPDWVMRLSEKKFAESSEIAPIRAGIIASMRKQRAILEYAVESKLPEISDDQLWAMFTFHLKRARQGVDVTKMSGQANKFCQEGPNKGKPGPCPDPEKAKSRGRVPSADAGPTNAAPGSEDKIRVMQARFAKGVPLFDPKDGSAPAAKPTRKSVAKATPAAPVAKATDTESAAKSYIALRTKANTSSATFGDYDAEVAKLAKFKLPELRKIATSAGVGIAGLSKTQILTSMKRQLQEMHNGNDRFAFTKTPVKR